MKWSVVYEKAIREDGSLLFPERLSKEFLHNARKVMGSYLYANQYQNEIIPEGEQVFKKEWLKYWNPDSMPENHVTLAFIDPAIGQNKTHDYTGLVVVQTDMEKRWFVKVANRYRKTPTELVELIFEVNSRYQPRTIGFEDVAFQSSIIHFAREEAKRRGVALPLFGVKRGTNKTKNMRIGALVPRFEWGTLFLAHGLYDLEQELAQHPRSQFDDLLDSLASIEDIVQYPQPIRRSRDEAPHPQSSEYESWYRRKLQRRQGAGQAPIP